VFLAGVQLSVFPTRTSRYFAWTVDSPMSAVFLGASYWAALALELGAARAPRWAGARIAGPAVLVFTTATLAVTIQHADRLHLEHGLALGTRLVTWAWIAIYLAVPVLLAIGLVGQRRHSMTVAPPAGLPLTVRIVLAELAVLLAGSGIALLAAPGAVAVAWPWPLTPLTSGLIGAWLLGLGTASGHALAIDDRTSLRPLAFTGVAFGVLQAVALIRYGGEVDWGHPSSIAYLVVLGALSTVSTWALLGSPEPHRRPRPPGQAGSQHRPHPAVPIAGPHSGPIPTAPSPYFAAYFLGRPACRWRNAFASRRSARAQRSPNRPGIDDRAAAGRWKATGRPDDDH
jgi:hypothetical protein